MRILVVDDERPARDRLIRMLARIDGAVVVGEAGDGEEAARLIDEVDPDVVLLDVNMPRLDGMTLALERAGELPPIIFVTAYDQHALRAFDAGALDYLVKPVRQGRLEQALARVHGRRRSPEPVEALLKRLVSGDSGDDACRIAVACGGSVRFFDARQVTRFRSADKYTVFVHGGDELILEESLGALERRLEGHAFVRVHRGELVNLARVRALHSADGIHEVELDDGQRARVSRRSLPALKKALGI